MSEEIEIKEAAELTIESATAFIKQHNKEQSELCWKEMQEILKKYNQSIHVINSLEQGVIMNKVVLIKAS